MRRVVLLALLVGLPVALPAQAPTAAIKSPEEAFGFKMGADRQLAGWPEIKKYFEEVAAAWECHQWENCPMAVAYDIRGPDEAPVLVRPWVRLFVQLFDAKLLKRPEVATP